MDAATNARAIHAIHAIHADTPIISATDDANAADEAEAVGIRFVAVKASEGNELAGLVERALQFDASGSRGD